MILRVVEQYQITYKTQRRISRTWIMLISLSERAQLIMMTSVGIATFLS